MANRPNIYFFNPTSEMAVANGTVSWQPNRLLTKLESDLALLPAYFASRNDVLVTEKKPTYEFLKLFTQLDFEFPEFYNLHELKKLITSEDIKPGSIEPWGWSQVVHHKFEDVIRFCSQEFKESPNSKWNGDLRKIISREYALQILQGVLQEFPEKELLDKSEMPVKCCSLDDIEIAHANNLQSIVKLPWSSSGRGIQVINQHRIHPSIKKRLQGAIKNQGFVMAEKFLDKKLDFATHFKVSGNEIEYLGFSLFSTSADGKYSGNYLKAAVPDELSEYLDFLKSEISLLVQKLKRVLDISGLQLYYNGYLGIDGMVFQKNDRLKIHPCVEINLRYNMGLLTFELEKLLANESYGMFHQFGGKEGEFSKLMKLKQKESPLKIKGGKILQGILPLTEIDLGGSFGAYLEVLCK